MARPDLTVVVIGYDNVDIALTDYRDLARVLDERRLSDCEAAVLQRVEGNHEVIESTVRAKEGGTRLGVCLGVVAGLAVTPAVAAAIVGGGLGALIGNVTDQIDAFKHTSQMTEVERLIDDSNANLVAIADQSTSSEVVAAALRRERRVVADLASADTDALERELQREGLHWHS